ncbi:hypothetical protein HY357_04005 [Candidatus Roizmanbacteria bacterium]|nr:hypothetical protein [Candidatus Roizmanbacteria bacterium]
MEKLETVIDRARSRLIANPIDTTHDIEHHRNVAENCQKIIDEERLNVNSENIIIAAWWHDVETQQGATGLLQKEMQTLGFGQEDIKSVSDMVRTHTFGGKLKTVEAQVLFDADKMEYFNPERMRRALEDAKNGLLPTTILDRHYFEWLERYKEILELFNFETSKRIAFQNLPSTLNEIKKIGLFLKGEK